MGPVSETAALYETCLVLTSTPVMCHPQDPLNLSNGLDEEKTFQLQSAEIKHGRIAMVRLLSSIHPELSMLGVFFSELGDFRFGYTGPASRCLTVSEYR